MGKRRFAENDWLFEEVDDNPADNEPAYSVPVVIVRQEDANGNVVSFGGIVVSTSASMSRPTGTTAYSANDVINTSGTGQVLTFANAVKDTGGGGYITKARLFTDQSTNTARFRLHLYKVAPTPIADNAIFTLLWANRLNRIGYIDFSALATEGTGSDSAQSLVSIGNGNLPMPFELVSKDLYGVLETLDAFTPSANQNFLIELCTDV